MPFHVGMMSSCVPGEGSSNRTLAAGCSTVRPSRSGPAKVTPTMRRGKGSDATDLDPGETGAAPAGPALRPDRLDFSGAHRTQRKCPEVSASLEDGMVGLPLGLSRLSWGNDYE